MIKITFPDKTVKEFESGITIKQVATSISVSLAKQSVAGKLNNKLVRIDEPINNDASLEIVTKSNPEGLNVIWNTTALILVNALKKYDSHIKIGEFGNVENGFYVDTDHDKKQIGTEELPKLETIINEIIKSKTYVESIIVDRKKAEELIGDDLYQTNILNSLEDDQIAFSKIDDQFILNNLITLPDVSDVKAFKIMSVAGAYWQGKSSNKMLQRIYGTAFYKQKDLESELERIKESHARDHRVLGNQLELFFVDPNMGSGLPYWLPNGATVRRTIERYIIDKEISHGYQHVYTPILMNLDAYKTSGHWQHYRDDMFPEMDMGEGELLELRPMNCPSHIQIYKHGIRSYRDFPLRIAELGMMHRYEKSGALSGLQRVREMTLNDGHTFLMQEQIQNEFKRVLKLMMDVYDDFKIENYTFRLSYRDPENKEKYFDDDAMWKQSQTMLKGALDDLKLEYVEAEGEAAFYGPKLDVQTKTALGTEETLSTIQLDFLLPQQFDLNYVGSDGNNHRPVMIHRGLISTLERFTAYLIEMYKGAFPVWLAPNQVTIIPVNENLHGDYANTLKKQLINSGIRVKLDDRNEKMNYKIREAQTQKIPYVLVVGDEELKNHQVSVRKYSKDTSNIENVDNFIEQIINEIKNHQ